MALVLRALIAEHDLAARAADSLGVECCPLTEDLSLVPLLAAGEDPGRAESSDGDPIFRLTPAEEHLAAGVSCHGPVAYVEAETFAGVGVQAAAVWHDGSMTLGPLVWDSSAPAADTRQPADLPINVVLAALGVVPIPPMDAFDTLGLGRHRFTEDWLTPAPGST